MRKLVLVTFLLGFWAMWTQAQTSEVSLFSGMDGTFLLYPNSNTNFWGYGYMDEGSMTMPAPLLRFDKGDDVNIEFTNLSPESHTIHLHGLDVDQVNDGVPQTSFYVMPEETVNYSFEANNEGTFLYHCHVTTTLHLTMGMYGMIVVEAGDNQLYEGGPVYDRAYEYLMSDCEISVNDAPALAFPFHEIHPDYFMVNGRSGGHVSELFGQSLHVAPEEKVALRLGSMAYSLVKLIFPDNLNATVYMSDGRVLETSFGSNELEIYPGERFSLLLEPELEDDTEIEVQYFNMMNGEYLSSNFIPVILDPVSIDEVKGEEFSFYPNPTQGQLNVQVEKGVHSLRIYDLNGKLKMEKYIDGVQQIDLSALSAGIYIVEMDGKAQEKLVIID